MRTTSTYILEFCTRTHFLTFSELCEKNPVPESFFFRYVEAIADKRSRKNYSDYTNPEYQTNVHKRFSPIPAVDWLQTDCGADSRESERMNTRKPGLFRCRNGLNYRSWYNASKVFGRSNCWATNSACRRQHSSVGPLGT